METKELKITCPEGYEIDKEKSTFECIVFKPIKKELPTTWEEFCETHPKKEGECYITGSSRLGIINSFDILDRAQDRDRNILPSKELAEAMLALCQLIQLRDCYNDGWKPDWNKEYYKYNIGYVCNTLCADSSSYIQRVLSFKSGELRDEFLENFRDLIETAKPLL